VTVNLTRIYTKLGDAGETHLGDMSRVSKLDPRVEAYGTVDELNATLGVALIAPGMPERVAAWLGRVQNDLLDLGADLSVPGPPPGDGAETGDGAKPGAGAESGADGDARHEAEPGTEVRPRLRVTAKYTEWLESVCDEVNAELPPLRSFVIPGGTAASAQLHVCRTVCRRAERRAIAVGVEGNPEVVRYLNRLSDMLFILARSVNRDPAEGEPLWDPGAHAAGGTGGSG
jgi:cob(I)alamin adenosyltransferase